MGTEALEDRRLLAFTVNAFTPTPSGFVAQFNQPVATSGVNLYDSQSGAFGAADVTLVGQNTGHVQGSLVVDGNQLTFVATGGALPADSYTVTLRSAANAIRDQALGELLDGEFNGSLPSGNGVPGGNFVRTFALAAPNQVVVSLADVARGPGQSIDVLDANGQLTSGLPIRLSNPAGVTSVLLTVQFNPDLLAVTGATLGPDAPAGSQVETNLTVAGQATIAFFALDPLPANARDVIRLTASVPTSAPYGSSQVLDVTDVEVNAGLLTATGDDGLHVVAYPGDANRNQRYDVEDARLIARVGVGLDTGFAADPPQSATGFRTLYPTIDPLVIGDVTGRDGLSPLDASDLLRRAIGLSTPNIPAIPASASLPPAVVLPSAPTGIALSGDSVSEAAPIGTVVGVLTAADADVDDSHTFSLVAGPGSEGNASFTLLGNLLRTASTLDRESQSSISVRVRATDSSGLFTEQSFTIQVTNANETPTSIGLSNPSVFENQPAGTVVGSLSAVDPDLGDAHTFSLVAGNGSDDNGLFLIDGNELKTAAAFDFEARTTLFVRVRATDQSGDFTEEALRIFVINVNEAPAELTLSNASIAENQPAGTFVGILHAIDPDLGDVVTFSFADGEGDADNASFVIVGDELQTATAFDRETQSSRSVRVRATDAAGLSVEQAFTLSVTPLNEAPAALALSNALVAENEPAGTVVGVLSATDPDAGELLTFDLVAGEGDADNALLTIDGSELKTAAAFDRETQSELSIRVRATDQGGLATEQTFTIQVANVNEGPTAVSLSNATVAENQPAGTVIGVLSATDVDLGDAHTFTLVSGEGDADNGSFVIVGNELKTAAVFDFESQAAFTIRVRATDADGLSTEQVFTITVTNVNEAPTDLELGPNLIHEHAPLGTFVGRLTVADPDRGDSHTFTLVDDAPSDNAFFVIEGNELKKAGDLDFETDSALRARVQATDAGGLSVISTLFIFVLDDNDAPTDVTLSVASVAENVPAGTVVGLLATADVDAIDSHTFTLVAGDGDTDNAAFLIDGNELKTATTLDFETQSTYHLRVRVTDFDGASFEKALVVNVTDENESPTAVMLADDSISEHAPVGTVVGLLSAVDVDAGDSHTFTLVAGEGDADNAAFTLDGNELKTAMTLDFETQSTYLIRVRATDADGLSVEQALVVQVTDVTNTVTLSSSSVPENAEIGTVVGMLATADPLPGDSYTFSLVAGEGDTDNGSFTIDGNELKTAAVFDHESQAELTIRVRATDKNSATTEQVFRIGVTNVNESPFTLALSSLSIAENEALDTLFATLSGTDPDIGDLLAFDFASGEGDDDNALFNLAGNELKTATVFDHETQPTLHVRLRATDVGGLTTEQTFTIGVTDVNE